MRSTFAWDMERVSGTSKQYTGKPSLSLSPPRIPLLGPRAPPQKARSPNPSSRHLHLSFPLHRQSFPDPKVGIVPAPMLTSNRIYATGAAKPKPYGVFGG